METSVLRFLVLWFTSLIVFAGLTGCAGMGGRSAPTIWFADERDDVQGNTARIEDSSVFSRDTNEVRLSAARNETIAFQIVLAGGGADYAVSAVDFADFQSNSGNIAASNVEVRSVEFRRVDKFPSWFPRHTGQPTKPIIVADRLKPLGGDISPGAANPSNHVLWVDLHVPSSATAGQYTSVFELKRGAKDEVFARFPVRLTVYPVTLPAAPSLPVVTLVDPRDLLQTKLDWPHETAEETRLLPSEPSHKPAIALVNEQMKLLHEHGLQPALWASFPKYADEAEGNVAVDWNDYDALVRGWIDGSAYDDGVGASVWPVPANINHPLVDRYNGYESARYARALSRYLRQCEAHFKERGWHAKAVACPLPLQSLDEEAVAAITRLTGIVKQSEISMPLAAYASAESPRSLGLNQVPNYDFDDVGMWVAPAKWQQPDVIEQQRALGAETWMIPDEPPFSGSLHAAAPPVDAQVIPWIAYLYDLDGIWLTEGIEATKSSNQHAPLVLPGNAAFGPDSLSASLRLKRLRRGLQDYEMLRLLEGNGKALLAKTTAKQLVRWALADACLENLISTKETGWPLDPDALRLARMLVLRELSGDFEKNLPAREEENAAWARLMAQSQRVRPEVRGVRVTQNEEGLRATVFTGVTNGLPRDVLGTWSLPSAPVGWSLTSDVEVEIGANERRLASFDLALDQFVFNTEGVYPFDLQFRTNDAINPVSTEIPARLAIVACPRVAEPPTIDGKLDDWKLATNNAVGDFQLVRLADSGVSQPKNETRAFFAMDDQNLYISVRCAKNIGEQLIWRSDNEIEVEGGIPWGQDVVEVLLDPRGVAEGGSSDIYCLQVKPNGLLIARKGCRTNPPTGTSVDWNCAARVAAERGDNAWTVEMSIPLEAFGGAGDDKNIWGCNITRLDAGNGEYSTWSGATSTAYLPLSLGNLVLLRP
ncbi:MAG: glycoside hydrolase domain-containing protein [Phycisphaerae bacterium]